MQELSKFTIPQHLIADPSRTLLDLYDWNGVHNANASVFRYLDGNDVKTISWREVNEGTHRAAALCSAMLSVRTTDPRPVVAVFANRDAITYFTTIVGVLRAGFIIFPISYRNSPEALAHLLTRVKAIILLTSEEPWIQDVIDNATKLIAASSETYSAPAVVHAMPVFEDLYSRRVLETPHIAPCRPWALDDPSLIMHSSGSAAFPKPITWSVRGAMQWALSPSEAPDFRRTEKLTCTIGVTAVTGCMMATFKPCTPAILPTPENVFEEAKRTGSEMICTVPSMLEKWARDPTKVEHMKTMEGITFGGAPLLKEAGDYLVSHGVSLRPMYGSTETGMLAPWISACRGSDWQYVKLSKQFDPVLIPHDGGAYELIVTARSKMRPAVLNTTIDGMEAYATNDLLVPHPNRPDLWVVDGRVDDQIMLSTGEKTNPGPLERILAQDPHIQSAVIFGRSRTQNGVIIEPRKAYWFDIGDDVQRDEFVRAIWPAVERMNMYAPQHSRLFKEMIIFSSPSKPFMYTGKGTARRQAIIALYQPEIEALYEAMNAAPQVDIAPPISWTESEILKFTRDVVHSVLRRDIPDGADIFQFGCDRRVLQATWIFNQIVSALRTNPDNEGLLPRLQATAVYTHPSISSLCDFISRILGYGLAHIPSGEDTQAQQLEELLKRYTSGFIERSAVLRDRPASKDVVLVTGTTGGLGCHILMHLLSDPTVGTVFAFNRPDRLRERQEQAFRINGLDVNSLDSPKLRLVGGYLNKPNFGLGAALFREIQDAVTHVIHNAWKVDFNQRVTSFLDLLDGVQALINMCLASPWRLPSRILFTSSMGVFLQSNSPGYATEEQIEHPSGIVATNGYAESKWLAERMLWSSSSAGMNTLIVRVGQLCGGVSGYWNEKEWFPSIVKSAQYVGCLPALEENVTWIPCDEAALALIQMRNAEASILHLAHPRPVPWRRFLEPIAHALQVPLVPYTDWLSALKQSGSEVEDLRQNPAFAAFGLLQFSRHRRQREGAVREH
ncbi:hypothetical protein NM688_g1592 [Phlebia brevispora]|uniref:Uncharacterized protein n=1 Tax=Phlebia brevispora TaxID=194682 RepID=A0ACC1TBP4_9APHY|nr:hypothetical protein NM688_g1592 [Phlebia brevispora]